MAPRWCHRAPDLATHSPSSQSDAKRIKYLAKQVGFDLCRITSATPLHTERAQYLQWLADGRQAGMQWMTPERAGRSADVATALPGAASVICVGMQYWSGWRQPTGELAGQVARYAWGADYHTVLGDRLDQLVSALRAGFGGDHRWFVDTGPMMDKALAARSGLGWYGKNTNILTEEFGSFVLLGELITTLELSPDEVLRKDCGSCRLCAVACPTGALGPDYQIDANKCISYLTIEHRDAIPVELRPAVGTWVFGCDICQDVCPPTMKPYLSSKALRTQWVNEVRHVLSKSLAPSADSAQTHASDSVKPVAMGPLFPAGTTQSLDLLQLLRLSHDQYLQSFRGTAIRRAKVWMLRRNAAIALGNSGDAKCVTALAQSLQHDEHPIVRGHAAWALGQIGLRHTEQTAWASLDQALLEEHDASVVSEIVLALTARALSRRADGYADLPESTENVQFC